MGAIMGKNEKAFYHQCKNFIELEGHPFDKVSFKYLVKWTVKNKFKVTTPFTLANWDDLGFLLWDASENNGDTDATKAMLAWKTIYLALEKKEAVYGDLDKDIAQDGAEAMRHLQNGADRSRREKLGREDHCDVSSHLSPPPPCSASYVVAAPPPSYAPCDMPRPVVPTVGGRPQQHGDAHDFRPQHGGGQNIRSQDGGAQKPGNSHGPAYQNSSSHDSNKALQCCQNVSLHDAVTDTVVTAINQSSVGAVCVYHPPAGMEIQPCCSDLTEQELQDRKQRWATARSQAVVEGDAEFLQNFPVFADQGRLPKWEPVPYPVLKDLRKAITDYGLGAPFTMGIAESLFSAYILIPYDIRTILQTVLTSMQLAMFETEWKKLVHKHANEEFNNRGVPAAATTNILLGEGPFVLIDAQIRLPLNDLNTSKNLALKALKTVATETRVSPSFTLIQQGPKESFIDFAERLRESVIRQIVSKEAQDAVFLKLAIENANADCQSILRTLKDPTITDMIQACKNVGTLTHKKAMMAQSTPCFNCQQPGHYYKNCPKANKMPDLCPRCRKGKHWARDCRSLLDIDGKPLSPRTTPKLQRRSPQGNHPQSATRSATTKKTALKTPNLPVIVEETE